MEKYFSSKLSLMMLENRYTVIRSKSDEGNETARVEHL